ncbi:lipopolysaccharide assembly LapA domain-containing protein [Roseateles sp.]|jgi:putative membrane protein|uniref:lipopolysaccharide assembly LapA domain-containing protein n=1 Tax=Roseateles sp. TaxID=1971397 RepID=UPI0037C5AE1C
MRFLVWLLRAFLFFALFAFALNNSQEVQVRWFFGHDWRSPLVIVVLIAFGLGCAVGVLAMVPAWWKHRRQAQRRDDATPAAPSAPEPLNPIRDGL